MGVIAIDDTQTKLFTDITPRILEQLPKGIFLNVGGEQPNTMTIGWGSVGTYWGKPIITVPIRPQRFTFGLLAAQKEFILSVPNGNMTRELVKAGTLSGRDGDKFERIGLTTRRGGLVDAPIITDAKWQVECKVLSETAMTREKTDDAVSAAMYAAGDYHVLFMAEVVACYETE